MNIQLSYPIVDIRPFLEEDTHQIEVPMWDYDDDTFGEFVRHFGHIRLTNSQVEHLPKTPFSKAKGAVKLHEFNDYNFLRKGHDKGPATAPYPHRRLFVRMRRQMNDPFSCEARFDFGVKIKPAGAGRFDIPDLVAAEESIHTLIKRFLDFPVTVGTLEGTKRYLNPVVGKMGPSIANLYLYASSRRNRRSDVKKYWVDCMQPTVILQIYGTKEIVTTFLEKIDSKRIIRKFTNDQFQLLQFPFKAFGKTFPIWVVVRNDPSREARQLEQQLTWNIIRGHAEYQTAAYLAKLASRKRLKFTPRSEASQRFQYLIDQIITSVSPREQDPPAQTAIFQAIAQDHFQAISVEDCLELLKNLSHIRKNVLRKLGNFAVNQNALDGTPIDRLIDEKRSQPPVGIDKKYLEKIQPYVEQSNLQGFEEYIRYLVSQNKLKESLETLRAYLTLSNIEGDPPKIVAVQLQRYHSAHQAFERGWITREYFSTLEARLSDGILNLFQEIPA